MLDTACRNKLTNNKKRPSQSKIISNLKSHLRQIELSGVGSVKLAKKSLPEKEPVESS